MKKAAVISFLTLLVLVMILTALTYIGPHLGFYFGRISSRSMEPELKTGSLIVSCPVDTDKIKVEDIITFNNRQGSNRMVHRVIEVRTESRLEFITKGDANLMADSSPVIADAVLGRVCLHIPGIGSLVDLQGTTAGFICGLVCPAVIIVIFIGWYLLKSILRNA